MALDLDFVMLSWECIESLSIVISKHNPTPTSLLVTHQDQWRLTKTCQHRAQANADQDMGLTATKLKEKIEPSKMTCEFKMDNTKQKWTKTDTSYMRAFPWVSHIWITQFRIRWFMVHHSWIAEVSIWKNVGLVKRVVQTETNENFSVFK